MDRVSRRFALMAIGVFGVLSLIALVPSAMAANGNVSMNQLAEDAEGNLKPQAFHLLVLNEAQTDLLSANDPNHAAEYDFVLGPSYKLNPDWTLAAKFPFKQELTGYERVLAEDAKMALSHVPISLNRYQKIMASTAVRIPLSDESRNIDTMYVGGQIGAELDNDLSPLGFKNVSLNYTAVLGRNFYQYTQSAAGYGNIVYDFSQRADLNYQFLPRWSVTGTGKYITGMDYMNTITGKFEIDEELDYQIAKAWSAGVGHSNSADVLQPDGHDSNFAVYNPYTSTVFGVLSFTY